MGWGTRERAVSHTPLSHAVDVYAALAGSQNHEPDHVTFSEGGQTKLGKPATLDVCRRRPEGLARSMVQRPLEMAGMPPWHHD